MHKHFAGVPTKFWFSAFTIAFLLLLAACGGASPTTSTAGGSTPSAAPTATPTPTTAPTEAPTATASTSGNSVAIAGFAFSPQSLTVKVGTTVTWTNNDGVAHTVTSDDGKTFDSGQLAPGKTFSFTFTKAGTYTYHCSNHPATMKATIIVQ